MPDFLTLDYGSVVPMPVLHPTDIASGEFIGHEPLHEEWGELDVQFLSIPEIQVVKFDASIKRDVLLKKGDEYISTTVDTCIFLDGAITSDFAGQGMAMSKGMQNFIYHPATVTDHFIRKQDALKLLHISIDRGYFSGLLSDNEKWSAELKENLVTKKWICGPVDNMKMSANMFSIVNDILNCPLSGNLRTILLEAKIIEFVALQLNQLVKERSVQRVQQIKPADKDKLYALREHLQKTFTQEHSLRNLARHFGINEFKLKKGFRELFGTTVFDYLHDLKMEFARQLLAANEVYVNEISGRIGYKNPNHFSTAFKKKFGVNPSLLRK